MTNYTDLIEQLLTPGDEVYSTRKKWLIADAIEALVKEVDLLERRKECWQRSKDAAERTKLREQLAHYERLNAEQAAMLNKVIQERDKCIEECNEFWGKKSDADYEQIQSLAAELAALRKQIDELQPVATVISSEPFGVVVRGHKTTAINTKLYSLEGIKK